MMRMRNAMKVVGVVILLLAGSSLSMAGPSARSLNARWTARIPRPAREMPDQRELDLDAIDDNGDTLVSAGERPSELYMIDGKTGVVRWRYRSRKDGVGPVSVTPSSHRVVLKDTRALVPGSEQVQSDMVMLDADGHLLWKRDDVPGGPRISPSGEHILTFNPLIDFGVRLYRGSDGALLWQIPYQQLGLMEDARFTSDGQRILVHTAQHVRMFALDGDLLWSISSKGGVEFASTSADGSITAILGHAWTPEREPVKRLLIVDRTGQELSGVELLRSKRFQPPDPELGDWYEARVSADGATIVLEGILPGVQRLLALSPSGNVLWELKIPGSGLTWELLPTGTIVADVYTSAGSTFYLIDSAGIIRETSESLPRRGRWQVSPNGIFLSEIKDYEVWSFAVPAWAGQPPRPSGRELPRSDEPDLAAWVGLRQSLHAEKWSVKYKPAQKEVVARSKDGTREVRLRIGSTKAVLNGKEVSLPGAPRIVRNRVEVPSMVPHLVAQAI